MLANLLPGLRDLRAPLAAGYLWLVVAWLQFAPKIPDNVAQAEGLVGDVYTLGQAAGRAAVGVAISFVAYLLGILSTEILTRLMQVPLRIVVLVASLPQIIREWYRYNPRAKRLHPNTTYIRGAVNPSILDPLRSRVRILVLSTMVTQYQESEKYREAVIDHVRPEWWQEVLEKIPRFLMHSRYDVNNDEPSHDARSYVLRAVDRHDAALSQLLATTIDVDQHVRHVQSSLRLIPERLVGEKPAVYERWDRLSSEGEFREAIVPPLLVLAFVVCLRQAVPRAFLPILLLPPLAVLYQGYRKQLDASMQLTQTIEAGVATSPAVERLKSTDLYWQDPTFVSDAAKIQALADEIAGKAPDRP